MKDTLLHDGNLKLFLPRWDIFVDRIFERRFMTNLDLTGRARIERARSNTVAIRRRTGRDGDMPYSKLTNSLNQTIAEENLSSIIHRMKIK
jgi:hypothetical protein